MDIEKKTLCNLDHCYAVSVIGAEENIFFASEAAGSCISFDRNGENPFTVWDYPGGTMGMVEIPESGGDFLAVQNFLPVFQSEKASLVWVHRNNDDSLSVYPFADIPYVHRFDLLRQGNVTYLIACTLCTSKKFTEDWSDPGKVYAGIMPLCPQDGIKLDIILEGLTHNHGYCRGLLDGCMTSLVGCDEGVFAIQPPNSVVENWKIEKLLHNSVGDIAMVDINGDGVTELAAIEPFHGSELVIYQKNADGYTPIYRHPEKLKFGHTIWGGELLGAPAILCGCRGGKMELFCLRRSLDGYRKELIDQGYGPSNIAVLYRKDADVICTANRQAGQAVLYLLTPKNEEEVVCQNI